MTNADANNPYNVRPEESNPYNVQSPQPNVGGAPAASPLPGIPATGYRNNGAPYSPQQPPAGGPAFAQQPYYAAPAPQMGPGYAPREHLREHRSYAAFVLLGIVTFGLYPIWVAATVGEDLNTIATKWDHRRTLNYWLVVLLLSFLTFGIMVLVWWHSTSDRFETEARRRGLPVRVTAVDYWLWCILGAFIIVGPFIFAYKWLLASNELNADYNRRGDAPTVMY